MPALFRLWEQFDKVIDAEDCDGSFGGELEALCLNHRGFIDTGLTVISGFAIHQVQTNPKGQGNQKYANLLSVQDRSTSKQNLTLIQFCLKKYI